MTKRTLIGLLALFLAIPSALQAQDEIRYLEPGTRKEATVRGAITEETPSKIVFKPEKGKEPKEVPAWDVVDVIYALQAASSRLEYRNADAKEKELEKAKEPAARKKILAEAIKLFQSTADLAAKASESKFVQRHLQYKIARLHVRAAEEDPSTVAAAMEALGKFQQKHSDGWQISACAKLLAELQLEKEDYEGARKTFESLAATPNISKEIKQDCELMVAYTVIKAKKHKDAEAMLQGILKNLPPNDPQVGKVQVLLAECQAATGRPADAVKQLTAIIDKSNDNNLKAMAYNKLGECYLTMNKHKDALYAFLWVDIIYNQDKTEHQRAMENLAKLFESGSLKDETKAKMYRDRLKK